MQIKPYNEILNTIDQFQFVLIDQNLIELYPEIAKVIEDKKTFYVKDAEKSKSYSSYIEIVNFFLEKKVSRSDSLLAIGGGALSDLAGFVAATLLRGIKWEVIPTTLLAMIDASIGGKVGINTDYGKNLIGAFHEPKEIHVYPEFLKTLSDDELKSGQGELLKYAFLDEEVNKSVLELGYREEIITSCMQAKVKITERDFNESDIRKTLNFGHTFGHAIEKELQIPHGVAVFYGIEMIINIYSPEFKAQFEELKTSLKFNFTPLEKMDFDKFCYYLSFDKKRTREGEIEFILPIRIGEMKIVPKSMIDIKEDLRNHELYKHYFI